jgi:hypothetical protein
MLVSSSRRIGICKLNLLLATLLPLGGCGIIITVFSLAVVALHNALFSAGDGIRNEQGRETVATPFSFFN